MIYERKFILQAAHFNSGNTYKNYRDALTLRSLGVEHHADAFDLLKEVLNDLHGHNFEVKIIVDSKFNMTSANPYVIDDDVLSKIVLEWDNKNLSTLEDFEFQNMRATTESMAQILKEKINDKVNTNFVRVDVEVLETRDIKSKTS